MPRFGHTAVERNVLKRRLRELVRTELLPGLPEIDAVVRALPSAYRTNYDLLRTAMQHAGQQVSKTVKDGTG